MRQKTIAEDLEKPGIWLTVGIREYVYRRANFNADKAAIFQHLLPACTRQATGNSSGPEIDVADRRFRHRLAVRDVAELQISAGAQDAHDLSKGLLFVGTEIDDAV